MRHGSTGTRAAMAAATILVLLTAVPSRAGLAWTFSARAISTNCHTPNVEMPYAGESGSVYAAFDRMYCPVDVGPGEVEVGELAEVRVYVTDHHPDRAITAKLCVRDLPSAVAGSADLVCGDIVSSIGSDRRTQAIVVPPPALDNTADTMVVNLVITASVGASNDGYSYVHGYTIRRLVDDTMPH
jgi:hypothetical protein